VLPPWVEYSPEYLPTNISYSSKNPNDIRYSSNSTAYIFDPFLFVKKYLSPIKKDGLKVIGHKIKISFASKNGAVLDNEMIEKILKYDIEEGYFRSIYDLELKLYLNNEYKKEISPSVNYFDEGANFFENTYKYEYGYIKGDAEPKPFNISVSWVENSPNGQPYTHMIAIRGESTTYYSKEYKKDILITSNNGQKLVRGRLKFKRHYGPKSSGEHEVDAYIINGKEENEGLPLYAGHYIVKLEEPNECNETIYSNLILTPEILEEDKPLEIKVVCSYAYTAQIKGDIFTEGDYGGKFYFDLIAEDVITHDEKEKEDFNTRGISIDDEKYPLNTEGERLTLPMRELFEEKEIYYTSWSEKLIENNDSFLVNNTTKDIYKCPLQSGHFGFIRIYEDRSYFPGHTSKAGAYPSLDATFTCDMEAGGKIDLHIVVGPQVPLAVGGWDNMFNLTLDRENSEFLSDSRSFTEFLNKRTTKAQSPFKMKMSFEGKFVRKEIRIYEDFNTKKDNQEDESLSNGTFESTVRPYIYTDAVYFDNSENEVSIEVFAEYDKVKTLDYSLYCKRKKKKDKLLSRGDLNFNLMMENMGISRDSFEVKNPKECELFKIDFDDNGKYPISAFSPAKSLELSK